MPAHERHAELLAALLAPEVDARPAALRWLGMVDFDLIDVAEQRLMPLFDSRMRELGIEHPASGRVRGLYRRAWYVDQVMQSRLGGVLEIIGQVTDEAVLLKGAALGRLVYAHPAHRPYDDLDILVPPHRQREVLEALRRAGGIVQAPSFHATTVRMSDGLSLDIHRSPYHLAFRARHAAPLFERLRPIELPASGSPAAAAGSATRRARLTLGNADQLLHTLLHGQAPAAVPPIRWLVDAALLLRREGERIDWDLLEHEARRLDLVEPAVCGLREVLRFEPNDEAARALARLEQATTPHALARWSRTSQEQGIAWFWECTRRNCAGTFGRIRLALSFHLARKGLLGTMRSGVIAGVPFAVMRLRKLLLPRRA